MLGLIHSVIGGPKQRLKEFVVIANEVLSLEFENETNALL